MTIREHVLLHDAFSRHHDWLSIAAVEGARSHERGLLEIWVEFGVWKSRFLSLASLMEKKSTPAHLLATVSRYPVKSRMAICVIDSNPEALVITPFLSRCVRK